MKKIVVKVGGSLLFKKENKLNYEFISDFCKIIQEGKEFQQIIIVCGGGSLAREFITFLRKVKINEALCDTIGIDISRINSKMIMACLKDDAYPKIPKNLEDLSLGLQFNKIITMGGIQPGQSTTTAAIEIAEYIEADKLIILTDVQGIYDKDPDKYDNAKLIKKITYNELQTLLMNNSNSMQIAAGEYRIFDIVSLQIIRRSKLKVYITSGKNLDDFRKFWLENKEINGTLISN